MASITKKQYIKTSKDGAIKEVFYGVKDCNYINYDGENQTLAEKISEIDGKINTLETSFQDGYDTIADGIRAYNIEPASNSPKDMVAAIDSVYNLGVETGEAPTNSKDAKLIIRTSLLKQGDEENSGNWSWTNPYGAGYVYVRYTDKPVKTYEAYGSNCYINGTKQSSSGGEDHSKTFIHDVAIDAGGTIKFSFERYGGIGYCLIFYYQR